MKAKTNPFKTKVCITISNKDAALKRPVSFVIRKVFLILFCTVYIGVTGIRRFCGISAYLMTDRLSAELSEQKARLALAAGGQH
jgi:hypothetical protein